MRCTDRNKKGSYSQLIIVVSGSSCRACGIRATVKTIEKLPDGFAMEATHRDGTLYRWVKYYSLDSLGCRKTGKPKIIICPKCRQKGKVNSFRPDHTRPDLVKYVIRHEKSGGTWGRNKIPKYRRCYISKEEDRKAILRLRLTRLYANCADCPQQSYHL